MDKSTSRLTRRQIRRGDIGQHCDEFTVWWVVVVDNPAHILEIIPRRSILIQAKIGFADLHSIERIYRLVMPQIIYICSTGRSQKPIGIRGIGKSRGVGKSELAYKGRWGQVVNIGVILQEASGTRVEKCVVTALALAGRDAVIEVGSKNWRAVDYGEVAELAILAGSQLKR